MPVPRILLAGLAVVLISKGAAVEPTDAPADPLAWPAPTSTTRPWTRWWWLGSAVDALNLERLLTEYHAAGLGGVEICPIYGAKGYEKRFLDYLSPGWMDMLSVTTAKAARLGMGVDMTTGTGWPMGGPWIPGDQASEMASITSYPIGPDGLVPEALKAALQLTRTEAPGANAEGGGRDLDGIMSHLRGQTRLLCLRAVRTDGSQLDLTDRVRQGRLDWASPGAGWSLCALVARQPVQSVKRAAPGDMGNVVDPYSVKSLDTFLSKFDLAIRTYRGAMPRAQFHDSFEYYGANWTPDLFNEFSRRRGYDLREHLPDLEGVGGDADTVSRVREDYRQTIADLHLEFIRRWTAWSHAHGSLTREQAHGAPANIEDIYAAADIPETEGSFGGLSDDQVPMLKFASSAAHVSGRTLASSETFTWLGEHFQVPLSQLKAAADTFFLTGTNHIVLHGIPYSPTDAPWPGWLFYASVNFGPNGGLWHDLPAFCAYATRCQSILQSGRPDNDVLLYFPVSDFWQNFRTAPEASLDARGPRTTDPLVEPFPAPGKWMLGSPFHATAMQLWHKGFGFDEVTDALLAGARDDPGARPSGTGSVGISLGGNVYRAVVIPPCRYMPVDTLRHLLELAHDGASIVFCGGVPLDVPGFANLEGRRAELHALIDGIPIGTTIPRPPVAGNGTLEPGADAAVSQDSHRVKYGAGLIVSGPRAASPSAGELSLLLDSAGVRRERMTDDGLNCIRRIREDGYDYFIVNTGSRSIETWVPLACSASTAVLLDPLLPDRSGVAAIRQGDDGSSVFLQLSPGQSLVLRTFNAGKPSGPAWRYLRPSSGRAIVLGGECSVHFVEGGPVIPRDFQASHLGSWTESDDPEAKRFSGTAIYSMRFSLPQDGAGVLEWRLDLGRVADSARVSINGRDITTLWCAPFCADVRRYLRSGDNLLQVEVTNVAANRIRDLDRRHVDWKSFYEINFVNRDYRPFDASGWPLRDSGLLGPVVLTPMDPMEPPMKGGS
jgi:hypothetical protein